MTMTDRTLPGAVVAHADPDGVMRVVVSGTVDAEVADVFAATCEHALDLHPDRLELDLSAVSAVGAAGVAVIAWCLSAGRRMTGGIGISVATAAGRRALLDATDRV